MFHLLCYLFQQNELGVDSMETETEDGDGNQGPVQKDISAVPSKRSRHSLADLLGATYSTGPAKKWETAED